MSGSVDGASVVGRDRERAAVAGAVATGRGGLFVVAGAAGTGRSAVLRAVVADATAVGSLAVLCPLAPASWPAPFGPAGAGAAEVADHLRRSAFDLVALDDVQGVGAAVVDLLAAVAVLLAGAPPVLVAAVRRPDAAVGQAAAAALQRLEHGATHLGLEPLGPEVLAAWTGAAALLADTGGVPALVDAVLSGGADRLRAAADDLLAACSDAAAAVVRAAALVGPRFRVEEVAAAADLPTAVVLDGLAEAARAGLVAVDGRWGQFGQEALRRGAAAGLVPSAALAAHARVAALLDDSGVDDAARERLTDHALDAAALSPAHAHRAVDAARQAARVAVGEGRYPAAAALLDRAVALADPPTVDLLLEQADATRRAGWLGRSRQRFGAAFAVAERAGDARAMAAAALGTGGIWVNEHRGSSDARRALVVWRRAQAALGPDDELLRVRLAARLGAEASYLHHDLSGMDAAVADVRRAGDPAALAEALSLQHHVLLGPRSSVRRDEVAEEMLDAAFRLGDEHQVLMALLWLAVDAYLVGSPEADRRLHALRERLVACPVASIAFVADAVDVMRATRAGRLAEAEAQAGVCLAAGLAAGDNDALAYYGTQLLAIRWRQGRHPELLDAVEEMVSSTTVSEGNHAFVAAGAALAAAAGDERKARRALALLPAGGIAAVPPSSGWLVTAFSLVEAAHGLADVDLAEDCYQALVPYAHLPVMASIAIGAFGPVERSLGRAAEVAGRHDLARAHLERALVNCRRFGEVAVEVMVEAELAALRARPRPVAAGLRVTVRARQVEVGWRDRSATIRDIVGARYLAELARTPGVGVPVLDLVARVQGGGVQGGSAQAVLDGHALSSLRDGLTELDDEIAEAERWHDTERLARLTAAREALVAEVSKGVNVRGDARAFAAPVERARVSVRKALQRAVDEVEAADADLGAHLRTHLQTGYVCTLLADDR